MAGRPRDVSDDEILEAAALARGPVVTASELADIVGMGNSGMNKRLDDLVAEGLLYEREVGANAKVYWLTPEGRERVAENRRGPAADG